MLRSTRSTPTPKPPADATAPVQAEPALLVRRANSNPNSALATSVDSVTELYDLP